MRTSIHAGSASLVRVTPDTRAAKARAVIALLIVAVFAAVAFVALFAARAGGRWARFVGDIDGWRRRTMRAAVVVALVVGAIYLAGGRESAGVAAAIGGAIVWVCLAGWIAAISTIWWKR